MSATNLSIIFVFTLAVLPLKRAHSESPSTGVIVKASQITSLRNLINTKLTSCSQPSIAFADNPLSSGVVIKALHLLELRSATTGLYTSQGLIAPPFTDPVITPKSTAIKSIHFTELATLITSVSCSPMTSCPAQTLTWTVGGIACSENAPSTLVGGSASLRDLNRPTTGFAVYNCTGSGAWVLDPTLNNCASSSPPTIASLNLVSRWSKGGGMTSMCMTSIVPSSNNSTSAMYGDCFGGTGYLMPGTSSCGPTSLSWCVKCAPGSNVPSGYCLRDLDAESIGSP